MVLIDTNVLIDIFENDPAWSDWSTRQLRAQAQLHELAINPIIYAELSVAFSKIEDLDQALESLGVKVQPLTKEALFLAGKAFIERRRRGGKGPATLPDLFIGAQAKVLDCQLLTRDVKRYKAYYPGLRLIAPSRN